MKGYIDNTFLFLEDDVAPNQLSTERTSKAFASSTQELGSSFTDEDLYNSSDRSSKGKQNLLKLMVQIYPCISL